MGKVPSSNRRARLIAGTSVLAVSAFVGLGLVAGIGLASGSSVSAQYQYGHRVTICHETHSAKHPWVTITIARAALKAHLRHGDIEGPCASAGSHAHGKHDPTLTTTTATTTTTTAANPGKDAHSDDDSGSDHNGDNNGNGRNHH